MFLCINTTHNHHHHHHRMQMKFCFGISILDFGYNTKNPFIMYSESDLFSGLKMMIIMSYHDSNTNWLTKFSLNLSLSKLNNFLAFALCAMAWHFCIDSFHSSSQRALFLCLYERVCVSVRMC